MMQATVPAPVEDHAALPSDSHARGVGHVGLLHVAGETRVVTARAGSPLRLLLPRPRSAGPAAARVVTSTYGGGLVGGDRVDLAVTAGEGTRTLLTTQASTKVYRSGSAGQSSQRLRVELGPDAVLASLPDPLTCFAGASYEQAQRFDLAPGASLVALDWLTSGRWACGERWAFDRYCSRWDVTAGGRTVFADATLLDASHGPLSALHQLGRIDCFATALIVGPAFETLAAAIASSVAAMPVTRDAPLVCAVSPIEGGIVLRAAGPGAEAVGRFLREHLGPVRDALGADPWSRT